MITYNARISKTDFEHILKHTSTTWPKLKNSYIFITGGTGFIGKWLLESIIFANDYFNLNIKVLVLTRNPKNFIQQIPHLAKHEIIRLHCGDIRNFEFPEGEFSHVIHGATDPSPNQDYLETYDVTTNGTKRILEFCRERHIKDVLLLSSGAVYGMQSPDLLHVNEQYISAPTINIPRTAYGQGKRISEWLASVYEEQYGIKTKIARCFALAGPYLPLNTHFALGNFILDAIQEKTIVIKGDGRPMRSYLYASDMIIWLWTIFIHGKSNVGYNLGSEEGLTLENLALRIVKLTGSTQGIRILSPINIAQRAECYVPSTQLARDSLGLETWISLDDALLRMILWAKNYL